MEKDNTLYCAEDSGKVVISFRMDAENFRKFIYSGLCETMEQYLEALQESRQEDADKILENSDETPYQKKEIRKTLIDKFYELGKIDGSGSDCFESDSAVIDAAAQMTEIYQTLFPD